MTSRLNLRNIALKLSRKVFPQSLNKELFLLQDSGYFDYLWYQQNNPDVITNGMDPLRHYLLYGGREGRTPGPMFDSFGYLNSNPDVYISGVNPLVHFLRYGQVEGRSPFGKSHENEIIADLRAIQELYIHNFGRPVNFRHPEKFTEKLQILKLAYRNPILSKFSDKVIAKEIVGEIIGKQYIVPLIGVYDRIEDIPREKLPNQFVLKANHGSGFTIICRNKDSFDWENATIETRKWLDYDFSMRFREWSYRNINRKLLVEQLLIENGKIPPDVKLHVFAGKVKEVQFMFDREIGTTTTIHLTPDWEQMSYSITLPSYPHQVLRPPQMDLMISLAQNLAQGFPYVRVDFFLCASKVYFSEMTYYPSAGFVPYIPSEWDERIGELLNMEGIYDANYFGNLSDKVLEEIKSEATGKHIDLLVSETEKGATKNPKRKPHDGLNILVFGHSSGLGGAERSLWELIRELTVNYDVCCTVVLPSLGPMASNFQQLGVKILIAPTTWWCAISEDELDMNNNNSVLMSNWLKENLELLKELEPDVVVTNTLVIPWGAIAALLLNKPHMWFVNEFGVLDHGLLFCLNLERSLKFILKTSDRVITRSKAIQNTLFPGSGKPKIETVYPYIQSSLPLGQKFETEETAFYNPDAFKLLLSGTISEGKGQMEAVNALKILVNRGYKQVKLLMPGESEPIYRNKLDSLILSNGLEEQAKIIPFQKRLEFLIDQADAILICSHMEGFGRVCLEAMLQKKPVIGAASGGILEIIQHEETGLLYKPGNSIALADQIERLMNDPSLRERLAEGGYNFADRQFSEEKFGGRINRILCEMQSSEMTWSEDIEECVLSLTDQYFTDYLRNIVACNKT